MGWWTTATGRLRDVLGAPRPIQLQLEPLHTFAADLAPQPIDRLLTAMRSGTGPVSRDDALSVAAVQRGRNELCSIAMIPLNAYRNGDVIPNPFLRQFDLDVPNIVHMAMTIEDLALCAIAWWEVLAQDYDGYPIAFRRLDPSWVSTLDPKTGKPDPAGRWVWIDRQDGRGPQQHDARLVKRFDSPNPGILRANARAIRIAMQLDRVTEMYADNPALREYFTDSDDPDAGEMNDDDIDQFLAEYGAMRRTQPYGWIPSTVKRADVASPSPRDLTLVDLQQQAMVAIANGLGVDPEDIGVSTTSRTYQNEDARRRDKITRMYGPYMRAITDRLSMGDITRHGQTIAFDLTEYLRADPTTRVAYYAGIGPLVGGLDPSWVARQEGIPTSAIKPTTTAAAPAGPPAQNAVSSAVTFNDRPALTFTAADFAGDAPAAPTVDTEARTITGLAVPYNAVASKYGHKYRFRPGALEYGDVARMPHLKDHGTPVGFHRTVTDSAQGPIVELAVLDGPEGSPAKAERDQLLYDAAHGLYTGLSIGVDFSPEDGDVEIDDDGVYNVVRATWRETSTTYMPAFDDARVTRVAASRTGDSMHCIHCGQPHTAGVSCSAYNAQITAAAQSTAIVPAEPARVGGPIDPNSELGRQFAAFQQSITQGQQNVEPAAGPVLVKPHTGNATVIEPSPYRFDRRGNLRAGSHDFSSDLFAGWAQGDLAARDRANSFVQTAFEDGQTGTNAMLTAQEQFAITPANVVNLNYPANRADLYVDQLDYQYPMYSEFYKGTLDDITPFVIPKFNSSSGLVGDHTTGTEPTPGTFTATAQTITPSALSGKVEITREAFDQGGNPQMSGLIWRQMTRAWYEGLEAYVQAQLVAAAASIPDVTITTAAADGALDQALSSSIVPLQYIRGGDRYRKVFTQIDLYKAMVAAKDTTNRRLYPAIGAMNAGGTADPRYNWLDAHGKLWIPAWATAASGTVAASSWMADPDVVCLWASAPRRIDLEWRVAWVDMGIWGYKAFGVTDFTRTREVVYDPI